MYLYILDDFSKPGRMYVAVIDSDEILFEGYLVIDNIGEETGIKSEAEETIDFSLGKTESTINQYHRIISLDMTLAE